MSLEIENAEDILRNEGLWCGIYRKWDVSDRIFDTFCGMSHKPGLKKSSVILVKSIIRERISAHLCDGQLGDLRMNYHYLSLLLCVLPNLEVKDDGGAREKMNEKIRVGLGVVDLLAGHASLSSEPIYVARTRTRRSGISASTSVFSY